MMMSKKEEFKLYVLKHLKNRFSRLFFGHKTPSVFSLCCCFFSFSVSRFWSFLVALSRTYAIPHNTDLKERRESLKETFCGFIDLFFFFTRIFDKSYRYFYHSHIS